MIHYIYIQVSVVYSRLDKNLRIKNKFSNKMCITNRPISGLATILYFFKETLTGKGPALKELRRVFT